MWAEIHLCDRFISGATSYPASHMPWNTTRTIAGDHSDGMGKVVAHLCRSSLEMGLDITYASCGLGVLSEQICVRKHSVAATLSTNAAAIIAPSILQSAPRTIVGDLSHGINSVSTHLRKSPSTPGATTSSCIPFRSDVVLSENLGKHAFLVFVLISDAGMYMGPYISWISLCTATGAAFRLHVECR